MNYAPFSSKAEAQAYEATCRKGLGLPLRGVHVGGGIHVAMSDDPASPGWTRAFAEVLEHPDGKQFAVPALEPSAQIDAKLSAPERDAIDDAFILAAPLDESWTKDSAALEAAAEVKP